jgi:hypothetical protein
MHSGAKHKTLYSAFVSAVSRVLMLSSTSLHTAVRFIVRRNQDSTTAFLVPKPLYRNRKLRRARNCARVLPFSQKNHVGVAFSVSACVCVYVCLFTHVY